MVYEFFIILRIGEISAGRGVKVNHDVASRDLVGGEFEFSLFNFDKTTVFTGNFFSHPFNFSRISVNAKNFSGSLLWGLDGCCFSRSMGPSYGENKS